MSKTTRSNALAHQSKASRTASGTTRHLSLGLALIGILLLGANLRASLTTVGPLMGEITEEFQLSSTAASALIGLPLLCFAAFSPIAPKISARFGLEKTLFGALTALAIGIVARSLPITGAIWGGTILLGAAIAVMNVLLPALLKRDFPLDSGRYTGLYSAAQSAFAAIGAAVAVPVAGWAGGNWRAAIGIWAGLALIAMAVFAPRLFRSGLARTPQPAESSSLQGGTGGAEEATGQRAEQASTKAEGITQATRRTWSPWRSSMAWMITIAMGTQSMVYYVVITWWPQIEQSQGISATAAGMHMGVLQLCGIGGNLAAAAFLQRFQRDQRGLILALTPMNVIGIAGMLLVPSLALVWSIVLGISLGAWIVFCLASFGLRTRHHYQAASLSGMAQSLGYLWAAVGPFALGALHDATGAWSTPLIVLLAAQALLLVTAYRAARPRLA